jgi:phosphoglycolate phosphatase-like HAD superfamily hydrolase
MAVGVATGGADAEQLTEAGAVTVLDDLTDTEAVLKAVVAATTAAGPSTP